MASILVPVLYLVIVFGGLFVFSYYYRKHTSSQLVESYFGPHTERNTYITLLQKDDPPTPEPLLKAALMRRAITDVYRLMKIREDKQALQILLQKGSVGDGVWASLQAAENETQTELVEVVQEANSFAPGWGQYIFPAAGEFLSNERTRALFERIPDIKAELETKYGVKAKAQGSGPMITISSVPPANVLPASSVASPVKPVNGLQITSPPVADLSDGEAGPPAVSPSKSSKKGKKRK